jgi:hypothetical protein
LVIADPPSGSVRLEPYAQADVPFATGLPQAEMLELRPLCLVLRNLSSKSIVGLTVRWVTTGSSGRQETFTYQTDSFFLVRRPVVGANARLLVAPGLLVPEGAGFVGAGKDQALSAAVQKSDSVNVSLDVVIFDDGQVVGPDTSHTLEQIRARKIAAEYVANAVSETLKAAGDPSRLLAQLAGARPDRSDLVGMWKSRVAHRLLHSRNLAKDLEVLQNLPAPNFRQ